MTVERSSPFLLQFYNAAKESWSLGHQVRGQGQSQGLKKKTRPKTDFSRIDPLEAKNRNGRGQGQESSTQFFKLCSSNLP